MTKPPTRTSAIIAIGLIFLLAGPVVAQRQMEDLDRGVVAIPQAYGQVFVSWRLLGTDPEGIAFNVYHGETRVNRNPLTGATNLLDTSGTAEATYTVRAVIDGTEAEPSAPAKVWQHPYLSIPLQTPEGYRPNDASVGDLDGDGQYEIVIHQAGRGRDNSQGGQTTEPIFEAYELDGTRLWRINLGRNIREGAHYTQFMVYDLDGDGRAEFACKTADGTIDGQGTVIGDAQADHRNERGYVLKGPEFLTIFDGQTGAALVTTDYVPARAPTLEPTEEKLDEIWGDGYGNRCDRFLACIAYLDGERPSLVMCRGYYTRAVLAAWNWRAGKLTRVWTFDSDNGTPADRAYRGQGYHSLTVGDIDDDGKDEIVYGACAIDDDGTGIYSTGLGHGDALHLSDIDPQRPGLEVWGIHENPRHPNGANLRDAATGKILFGLELNDPGRGLAMDIDPRYKGYECWANNSDGLYSARGEKISETKPSSCNMGIWWDGDLLREILDNGGGGGRRRTRPAGQAGQGRQRSRAADGQRTPRPPQGSQRPRGFGGFGGGRVGIIDKWDPATGTTQRLVNGGFFDCVTINGSKANPCLHADILGDWREEVIWSTRDGKELRLFSTTIPTDHRIYTLMHDPVYRLSVAWQNVAYNQPTQPGFYLGVGMAQPPRPNITLVRPGK